MTEPIHVLLVSDHDTCLNELTAFLGTQPDFIVHPANIGKEAERLLLQEPLSVGVLGFEWVPPFYAGLEMAMELLAVKPIRLILLTSMDKREAKRIQVVFLAHIQSKVFRLRLPFKCAE